MSNLTDAIEILNHGPAKDCRTAFECAYGVDSEQSALRDIARLLPALSAKGVMKLLPEIAATCMVSSAERNDDLWIIGRRIDECRESLGDELDDTAEEE